MNSAEQNKNFFVDKHIFVKYLTNLPPWDKREDDIL